MSDEPSAASTCKRRKRKHGDPVEHGEAKRSQTAQEAEETPKRSPRVSVPLNRLQQPITARELTELLHYAALGKTDGVKQPSWCHLHNQKRVKAVNVVIVEGLSQSLFYEHYLALHHLRTAYSTRLTFTPSATDLAAEIFSSEVPESNDPSLQEKRGRSSKLHKALMIHPVITRFGTKKKGLTAYVLSEEEMIKKHFPVKGMPGFEDFVCTDSVDCVTDSSPLYGLDCEMCLTGNGYELARVSLVDGDGKCLMDQLVRPQTRILNYLTKFSGITAAMLRPITTALRDVQVKLRELLPSDAVLVGHSLDSDLLALKMIHRHVIDTSLLYRRANGQKFKLKILAESVLQRQIQTQGDKGHNPTEDAVAALDLAQYFIKTGPRRVVDLHLEELWGCTTAEVSDSDSDPEPSLRFTDILQTLGRSVAYIGKRSDLPLDLSNQQWLSSDKEVLATFRRRTKNLFLSVLQLSSLSDPLRRCTPPQEHPRVRPTVRDMCVVFAGPFHAGVTMKLLSQLFSCCGPVRNIKILTATTRVHAEVEFELLEGAMLALKVLNGLNMEGQSIKVQRPVNESMLDLDLTLGALMSDSLATSHVYAVKVSSGVADAVNNPAAANGHAAIAEGPGGPPPPPRVNGTSALEAIREKFGHFGSVERVLLPAKGGKWGKREKRVRHVYIKFKSPAGRQAALNSSEDLWKDNYFVCPSLTPVHLLSRVGEAGGSDQEAETHKHSGSQDQEMDLMMGKLDARLMKLFKFLPEGTLSVVVLLGHTSAHLPGLCLMEVKQG